MGVVRDVGLDPDDSGDEQPYVFHAASAGTVSPLVMSVRVRGNPATLAARLPFIAAHVDARLFVQDSRPLDEWVRQRDDGLTMQAGALAAVTLLVLFLSALGIFSLLSVSVSRRTREIGLRMAVGANPRHVLAGILSRGTVLMGSGITAGGCPSAVVRRTRPRTLGPTYGRRCALHRVSWCDVRGDAGRVSACLHRGPPDALSGSIQSTL